MSVGRRAEPLEKRIARGNPQRRPIPENTPVRVAGVVLPPPYLSGVALDFWTEYSTILELRGQFTTESRVSFIALCECFAEWRELHDDIRLNGRTQKVKIYNSGKGKGKSRKSDESYVDEFEDDEFTLMERQRPQVSMFQDADRRLKGWLTEFGLTDASRGKVSGVAPGKKGDNEDPLAAYGLN